VAHFLANKKILGRAAELNFFVKTGAAGGYIEIELKGKIGKENLVVRRNLSSTSKGSTFNLCGHAATGREVTQTMNELNVQVGNLWHVTTFAFELVADFGVCHQLFFTSGQSLRVRSHVAATALTRDTVCRR
jgi:hypothetical protein